MNKQPVKYKVRAKSPLSFVFLIATIIAAYVLPLQNWVQITLLGIFGGVFGGFAVSGQIERSFDPPDTPLATKRRVIAYFGLFKLCIGFLIVAISLLLSETLAPAFIIIGAYMAGTTAASPFNAKQLGH